MAPLPENGTARVFIDYTSATVQHTIEFRLGEGASSVSALTVANRMVTVLKQRMTTADSFIAARFQDEGSNFSLPIAFTPTAGVVPFDGGSPWWLEDPESAFISFIGRGSATGRRVRWEYFTPIKTFPWPSDNRYNVGEQAVIDTLRTNFAAAVAESDSTGDQIVTIGGDIPVVYGYVNIAKNAYWQRKQR